MFFLEASEGVPAADKLAPDIEALFRKHRSYRFQSSALRSLKAELYKALLPITGKDRMVALSEKLLRLRRE